MSNSLRGEAPLVAGGETFTLVYDVNAFVEIEANTGLGFGALIATIQGDPSFTLLRQIICAGLQEKHPGTTLKDAGRIMSAAGLTELTRGLRDAMKAALPEVRDDSGNPPNRRTRRAKAAGTG